MCYFVSLLVDLFPYLWVFSQLSLYVNAGVVEATVGVEAPNGVASELTEDVATGTDAQPTKVVPPLKVLSLEELAMFSQQKL